LSLRSRNGRILIAVGAILIVALLGVLLVALSDSGGDDGGSSGSSSQDAALDADAKAGARTAEVVLEVYATDNAGQYAGATIDAMRQIDPTLPDNLELLAQPATYELTVTSDTGTKFTVARAADGSITRSCDPTGEGGCPDSGTW
jgi:hypothetical protein